MIRRVLSYLCIVILCATATFGGQRVAQAQSKSCPDYLKRGETCLDDDVERDTPGRLEVRSNPTGAEVTLDDETLGETPVTVEEVDPGVHDLRVVHPDRNDWDEPILVRPGEPVEVDVLLCGDGRVPTGEDDRQCCWPGQSVRNGRCAGDAKCPVHFEPMPDGDGCRLAACRDGRVRIESGACCWPGQSWDQKAFTCTGRPSRCPGERKPTWIACVLPPEKRDPDGDGLTNDRDACIDIPEDVDNHEDDDGCLDPDNDSDRIADVQDECPDKPEDEDGYRDADGCPDYDNDADGLADKSDECPDEPEDRDGYRDTDGCKDRDDDEDGIVETADNCPDTANPDQRDSDGDDIGDVCDDDRDGDRLANVADDCPDEPEDKDGFADDDGCAERRIDEWIADHTNRDRWRVELLRAGFTRLKVPGQSAALGFLSPPGGSIRIGGYVGEIELGVVTPSVQNRGVSHFVPEDNPLFLRWGVGLSPLALSFPEKSRLSVVEPFLAYRRLEAERTTYATLGAGARVAYNHDLYRLSAEAAWEAGLSDVDGGYSLSASVAPRCGDGGCRGLFGPGSAVTPGASMFLLMAGYGRTFFDGRLVDADSNLTGETARDSLDGFDLTLLMRTSVLRYGAGLAFRGGTDRFGGLVSFPVVVGLQFFEGILSPHVDVRHDFVVSTSTSKTGRAVGSGDGLDKVLLLSLGNTFHLPTSEAGGSAVLIDANYHLFGNRGFAPGFTLSAGYGF